MKRRRNRIPSTDNDRWYERYGQGGFFCLPRALLFQLVDCIDNGAFYVYVALASCHYEGNTTYAGPHIAKLTGKDERAVRRYLSDLETLGLIKRELLGQSYKIRFLCPDRKTLKEGAERLAQLKAHTKAERAVKRKGEPSDADGGQD